MGISKMTKDEEDRIRRAEEIQRYTENRCASLEKEKAELKKELQSERYNLKCRDDELAEARAFIEELQKQIRRTTQKLNFAVQDFLKTKPAWFQNYNEELERRVRELETE